MRVLVAGIGDVGGRAAAALAAAGHEVVGVRRSDAPGPADVSMVRGDLTDPSLVARLPLDLDAVLVSVSSDGRDEQRYRSAYLDGPTTLLGALRDRGDALRRVVFTSSSAVYGQRDDQWVDEDSPTAPTSATARVLVEAEHAIAAVGHPTTVLRLTGIYGPGRTRLLDTVRSGEAVVASRPSFTNRIHAHDAATACTLLLTADEAPSVVVGTDDLPADRAEVYGWLAWRLDAPRPTVDDGRAPARGSKRCRNDLLRSLGWVPRHPTFRVGYGALIDQQDAGRPVDE